MWTNYFKVIRIRPGRIVVSGHGLVDFSNPRLPVEFIQGLYERDFPYLQVTEQGRQDLYGLKKPVLAGKTKARKRGKTFQGAKSKARKPGKPPKGSAPK